MLETISDILTTMLLTYLLKLKNMNVYTALNLITPYSIITFLKLSTILIRYNTLSILHKICLLLMSISLPFLSLNLVRIFGDL